MIWNRPKSVRQIGEIPGRAKIYMEDYVVRFAKKLSRESRGEERGGVLLGTTFSLGESKVYQISGMVEIPRFSGRQGPELPQEIWEKIFTEIKENFTDLEIVGWYYTCRGFRVSEAGRLLEIHRLNFSQSDKILYIYEENGRDDGFFMYRGGRFEKQRGYYVYYEKNPEMYQYMEKEASRHVHIVEQEDDRVLRNIRGVIAENEKRKSKKKKENRLGYGLGVVVAMIAVLFGLAAMQNQNSLQQVQDELARLQQLALGEQRDNETTIETIGSSIRKKGKNVTPAAAGSDGEVSTGAAVSLDESAVTVMPGPEEADEDTASLAPSSGSESPAQSPSR